jgi:hypothetical protein
MLKPSYQSLQVSQHDLYKQGFLDKSEQDSLETDPIESHIGLPMHVEDESLIYNRLLSNKYPLIKNTPVLHVEHGYFPPRYHLFIALDSLCQKSKSTYH